MTPRELIDVYAYSWAGCDGECTHNCDDHRNRQAPKAFAALRAVLDLHQPEPDVFAVGQDGSCIGCYLGDPLKLTNYNVGGLRLKFHSHPYQGDAPICDHCLGEEDNVGEPVPRPVLWPCPTIRAIVDALEGP